MIVCVICGAEATHVCDGYLSPGSPYCPLHVCDHCVPATCRHCGGPAHQCEELSL